MPLSHERQVTVLALVTGLPAMVVALVLLWSGDFSARTQWTLTIMLAVFSLGCALALRERVIRPLQTLSNMLAAIREQDYSLRARRSSPEDALGLAMLELNSLMNELRERRLGALEATALLRRVMGEIDVAVLAFDDTGALRLINAGGERLLGQPVERLLGRRADELGLAACLEGDAPRVIELQLGGAPGRWELRRGAFRQGGRPHQFVLLADVSRSLREEERLAWQRLIRVLGHEINNSLTPIRSIADRLQQALDEDKAPSKALSFNEFGLVCITRKRTKQALERVLCQPCPYCTGSGMVKSIPTLCYEIQAEARKMATAGHEGPNLTLRVHPEISKALKTRESSLIEELELKGKERSLPGGVANSSARTLFGRRAIGTVRTFERSASGRLSPAGSLAGCTM